MYSQHPAQPRGDAQALFRARKAPFRMVVRGVCSAQLSMVQHRSAWLSMVQHNTACPGTGLSMKCTTPIPPKGALHTPWPTWATLHPHGDQHGNSAQLSTVQHGSAEFSTTPFGHAWVCRGSAQPPCPPKGALHAPWPTTSAWHTPQHPPNCSVWLPMAWRQLSSAQHPLAMHGFGDIWVCARNAQPPCPPEGALRTPWPTRAASQSRIDQYGN